MDKVCIYCSATVNGDSTSQHYCKDQTFFSPIRAVTHTLHTNRYLFVGLSRWGGSILFPTIKLFHNTDCNPMFKIGVIDRNGTQFLQTYKDFSLL
jgi:hypothetical protein